MRDSWRPYAAAAGAVVLAIAGLYPLWTNDVFGHLAAGREIVALGHVPDFDHFSFYFDRPQPWRNHNWGTGLLLYALYSAGGADAVVVAKLLVLALLGGTLVLLASRTRWAAPLCTLLMLWAVPAVRIRLSARPHLLGLLACALWLTGLTWLSRRRNRGLPWVAFGLLGLFQVIWINVHGSGPLAFLLTGAFLVGHLDDPAGRTTYLWLLGVLAAASCVSPWGPTIMLETAIHVGSEGTRQFIGEWAPLGVEGGAWELVACVAAGGLLAWGAVPLWRSGPIGRSRLLTALGLLLMAFRSVRFIAHALLLAAPFIASGLALRLRACDPRHVSRALLAAAAAGVCIVPGVALDKPPYLRPGLGWSTRALPAGAARWLERHRPNARVMGLLQDCWYISFAVPHSRVLTDGRQAVYPLAVLQRVEAALRSPQRLLALAQEKGADAIVLRHSRREHSASIAALEAAPQWGLASVGDRHVLFVRGLPEAETLRVLRPDLRLRSFTPTEQARARQELAQIGTGPGTRAYVGYQRALMHLSRDLRSGGRDGLDPPREPAARARYRQALADLAPALDPDDALIAPQLLATMLRLQLCQPDVAAQSLQAARLAGDNRHTVALSIELAIERGDTRHARAMLDELEPEPAGSRDPWVAALRAEALAPPSCRDAPF